MRTPDFAVTVRKMKLGRSAANAKLVALGKVIRKVRVAKGLSRRQLAARCKLGAEHIIRIELGKVRLRILTLVTIARALGISVAKLLGEAKL